jgi:hypothetical protein
LRIFPSVIALKSPVLRNNRKVLRRSANHRQSQANFATPVEVSSPEACSDPQNFKKFPVIDLETGFARLLPPPSSLHKPQVFGTTPNRAFLQGFLPTHFPVLVSAGVRAFEGTIFGALSLHPKILFPAAGL